MMWDGQLKAFALDMGAWKKIHPEILSFFAPPLEGKEGREPQGGASLNARLFQYGESVAL